MTTLEQTLKTANGTKSGEGSIKDIDGQPLKNLKVQTADPLVGALSLYQVEKLYINNVLTAANNNKTKAAKVLGVSLKTLYNKLARYAQEVVNDSQE